MEELVLESGRTPRNYPLSVPCVCLQHVLFANSQRGELGVKIVEIEKAAQPFRLTTRQGYRILRLVKR